MAGLDAFDSYKSLQNLDYSKLKLAVNDICAQMNSSCLNFAYWYDMYTHTSKSFMVISWREKNGFQAVASLGEAICKDKVVNFLKDEEHFKCTCSSVYYNAVF